MGLLRRDRPGRHRHVDRARRCSGCSAIARRDLRRDRGGAARARRARTATRVMLGRTHGQPGLPITFGFKAAVWAAEVRRHRERIDAGASRGSRSASSPARSARCRRGATHGPGAPAPRDGRGSGSACPDTSWLTARDRVAEFVDAAGADHRHAGEDRQRGLQPPAPGDRRALRGADRRASSAASRCRRSATRSAPSTSSTLARRRPRRRRARARGHGRRARARRRGVEDRVGRSCRGRAAPPPPRSRSARELVAGLRVDARADAREPRRPAAATCSPSR